MLHNDKKEHEDCPKTKDFFFRLKANKLNKNLKFIHWQTVLIMFCTLQKIVEDCTF